MQLCTLASGSSGNCALVSHHGTKLLIDAGISMRRITAALHGLDAAPGEIAGILITHEHSDHVCALKMLTKYHHLPVYAPRAAADTLCRALPELTDVMAAFDPGDTFAVGGLTVSSFSTPHDTPQSVGYRLEGGGVSLAFATDMGHVTGEVRAAICGVDAAVIESNHDLLMLRTGPYPYPLKRRILSDNGHLSNNACGDLAAELARSGTRRLILAHLSRENNTPRRAFETVRDALAETGILPGTDVDLSVAPAAECGPLFSI